MNGDHRCTTDCPVGHEMNEERERFRQALDQIRSVALTRDTYAPGEGEKLLKLLKGRMDAIVSLVDEAFKVPGSAKYQCSCRYFEDGQRDPQPSCVVHRVQDADDLVGKGEAS